MKNSREQFILKFLEVTFFQLNKFLIHIIQSKLIIEINLSDKHCNSL